MPPRRPRTQAWGQLRPDPWRNAVGAGADGGCDPASAPRFPGLGGTGRIRSVRPRGRRRRLRGCREPRRVGDRTAHAGARGRRRDRSRFHAPARESFGRGPHPTTTRGRTEKCSSPSAVAECAPPRGADPTCARFPCIRPCPERRLWMRSAARGRRRSQRVRPPRRTDGEAGWAEPGATRWRSWLTRAAEHTRPERRAWPWVPFVRRSGRIRAGAQRSGGGWAAARPSTGNGWWWGVATRSSRPSRYVGVFLPCDNGCKQLQRGGQHEQAGDGFICA